MFLPQTEQEVRRLILSHVCMVNNTKFGIMGILPAWFCWQMTIQTSNTTFKEQLQSVVAGLKHFFVFAEVLFEKNKTDKRRFPSTLD